MPDAELNRELAEKLKALASEACAREGCYLYDVDMGNLGVQGGNKHRVVRVFADCDAAPITVDQCANISQALSLRLDVEDLVPGGSYDLEVSSPGLERVLRDSQHYLKSIGQNIKLLLQAPLTGAENYGLSFSGTLKQAFDESILLTVMDRDLEIPYKLIKRARTIYDFNKQAMKKKR